MSDTRYGNPMDGGYGNPMDGGYDPYERPESHMGFIGNGPPVDEYGRPLEMDPYMMDGRQSMMMDRYGMEEDPYQYGYNDYNGGVYWHQEDTAISCQWSR